MSGKEVDDRKFGKGAVSAADGMLYCLEEGSGTGCPGRGFTGRLAGTWTLETSPIEEAEPAGTYLDSPGDCEWKTLSPGPGISLLLRHIREKQLVAEYRNIRTQLFPRPVFHVAKPWLINAFGRDAT